MFCHHVLIGYVAALTNSRKIKRNRYDDRNPWLITLDIFEEITYSSERHESKPTLSQRKRHHASPECCKDLALLFLDVWIQHKSSSWQVAISSFLQRVEQMSLSTQFNNTKHHANLLPKKRPFTGKLRLFTCNLRHAMSIPEMFPDTLPNIKEKKSYFIDSQTSLWVRIAPAQLLRVRYDDTDASTEFICQLGFREVTLRLILFTCCTKAQGNVTFFAFM